MNAKYKIIHTSPYSSPYRFSFLSNRIKALIGIDAELFLNGQRSWMQQIHRDDRQYLRVSISKLSEGDTITLMYRTLNNEGRYLSVMDAVSLETDTKTDELMLVGNLWLAPASDQPKTEA